MVLKATYYARLSGEHTTLPEAELRAVIELASSSYSMKGLLDLIALFEADNLDYRILCDRLAYTKSVGLLLGVSDQNYRGITDTVVEAAEVLNKRATGGIRVEVHRIKGYAKDLDPGRIAKSVAIAIERTGLKATPKSRGVLEVLLTEGLAVIGLRLCRIRSKEYIERNPGKRPFFKPGPLEAKLTRALVNLARVKRGSTFLDPFCGTGGFAIEACLVGAARILCGDIDYTMAHGSRINLKHYGCQHALSMCTDAVNSPVKVESVDAIATDPPYGRSTTTGKRTLHDLYSLFLTESLDLLRRGGFLVFAGPHWLKPHYIASDAGFTVLENHYMYVHGSLTRVIVVAKKP